MNKFIHEEKIKQFGTRRDNIRTRKVSNLTLPTSRSGSIKLSNTTSRPIVQGTLQQSVRNLSKKLRNR